MGFVRDAELLLAVLMLTNDAAAGSNTTNFSVLPRTAARYSSTALCRTHGETCTRAHVVAGALWRFDAALDVTTPAFEAKLNARTEALRARGSLSCPAGCDCSYCGMRCPGGSGPLVPFDDSLVLHGANCTVTA